MKKLTAILSICLIITSCTGQKSSDKVLAPQEFSQKLESEQNPQLIDVRTPAEFSSGHIDGAANIDWNNSHFAQKASELDKSRPVYVYCKIGGRSADAAKKLTSMGYEVYDLQGGIMKWDAQMGTAAKGGISPADFNRIASSNERVLINFYAAWCAPCKKMEPFMKTLDSRLPDVKVVRLDADKNKEILSHLKAEELPLTMYFRDGTEVWSQTGFIGEDELKEKLK